MNTQILVDLYKTYNPYSGLGDFSVNFYREIDRRKDLPFDLTYLVPPGFSVPDQVSPGRTYRTITRLDRYLPRRHDPPALWHSLYQKPTHPPHPKSLQVMTVHDLNFLIEREGTGRERALRRLQKSVDRADVLVAISEYTRETMLENLELRGKEVRVIYNGVRLDSHPEEPRPDFLPERPFFLWIGVHAAKKNTHVLLPLLHHFPEHALVLAGRHTTGYGNRLREEATALGVADRVIFPGTITAAEKYRLLADCDAFFFPSLAEGFGLPVIESLLAGRPTFTSDRTSLPEIGGGHTFLWRSFETEEMASVLAEGLASYRSNPGHHSEVYRTYGSRFSWERSIDCSLNLYGEILSGSKL